MSITHELSVLARQTEVLHRDGARLASVIGEIEAYLGQVGLAAEYFAPRPVGEHVGHSRDGKRVIELAYAGYGRVEGRFTLAINTVKVLESRRAAADEDPGHRMALRDAPRELQWAAVDALPQILAGLSAQLEAAVATMKQRCATADGMLRELHAMAPASYPQIPGSAPLASTTEPAGRPPRGATVSGHEPVGSGGLGSGRTHPGSSPEPVLQRGTEPDPVPGKGRSTVPYSERVPFAGSLSS